MSEILKKWDVFCKDATVKFGSNDTVVFSYAIVKITAHESEFVVDTTHHYVRYEEIKTLTNTLANAAGTFTAGIGKSKFENLIVGSKAVVIFAEYPQSENKSALTPLAIVHLKTGTCYAMGGFAYAYDGIEDFIKAHNLKKNVPVLNSGNSILPIRPKNYFKFAKNSLFSSLVFLALGLLPTRSIDSFLPSALHGAIAATVLCGLLGAIAALLLFSVLGLRNKLTGNATGLFSYLLNLKIEIFKGFVNDAPILWRELESLS